MSTPDKPKGVPGDQPMTLVDHLDSLRTHLLRAGKWVALAFLLCFYFSDRLMAIMVGPHQQTMEALGEPSRLGVFSYQETFVTSIKLALVGAMFVGMPMLMREIWSFISVGLYTEERKYIRIITPMVSVCFVLGTLFGYFVMVPVALRFLAAYGDRTLIDNQIRLQYYFSLFLTLTLALGLIFELPLVMWSLAKVGLFTAEKYASVRRFAIMGAVVVAAMLTPPDIITQMLMAGPMIVLYELGIMLTGGWRSTLGKGRMLIAAIVAIVVLAAVLGYDLFRVDIYLAQATTEGNELAWEGGGKRPFTARASGSSAKLLALAERAAQPAMARASTDDQLVPLAAALAAASPPNENLREFLRGAARDPREFVRDQVARALGAQGHPDDADVLEHLRTDKDRAVQVSAAKALLARGLPAGGFTLIKTLESGPPELAAEARAALVRARDNKDAGDAASWWTWYHSSLTRRPLGDHRVVVEILGDAVRAGASTTSPALHELCSRLLEDEDAWVRARACEVAPPDLLQRMAADPDPAVRLSAAESLVRLRDYQGISLLIGLLEDRQVVISLRAHQLITQATGQQIPERRASWEQWWRENEATFRWPR